MVFLKKVRKILNMDISDLFKSKSSNNLIGDDGDDFNEGEFNSQLSRERGFSLKKFGKDGKKLKKGFFLFQKKSNKVEVFDLKSNTSNVDSEVEVTDQLIENNDDIEIHSEHSQSNQSKDDTGDIDIESENDEFEQSSEIHVDIESENDEFEQSSEIHVDIESENDEFEQSSEVHVNSDKDIDYETEIDRSKLSETENVENSIEDKIEIKRKKGFLSFFKNTKQVDDSDKQSTILDNLELNQNQYTDANHSDNSDVPEVDDDLNQDLDLSEDYFNNDNFEDTTNSVSDSNEGRLNNADHHDIFSDNKVKFQSNEDQDEFLSENTTDSVDSQRVVSHKFLEKNEHFIKSNQVDRIVNKQDDSTIFEGSLIKKGSILSELDQLIVRQHIADEQERKKNKTSSISF